MEARAASCCVDPASALLVFSSALPTAEVEAALC